MEELLSMGFSQELASQALAATGGRSSLEAAEWILSQPSCSSSSSKPSSHSPNFQPSLDRFFLSNNNEPHSKRPHLSATAPARSTPAAPATAAPSATASPATAPLSERMRPTIAPLSERMRPANLDAVLGQDHLLGPASLLRSALRPPANAAAALPSFILWGPPGSGKTSLARALAVALPSRPTASSPSPPSPPASATSATPSTPPAAPAPSAAAPSSSSTRFTASPSPSRTPSSPPSRTAPSSSSEPPPRILPSTSPPRSSPAVESSPSTPSSPNTSRPCSAEPSQTLRKVSRSPLECPSWSIKKPSNSSLSTATAMLVSP